MSDGFLHVHRPIPRRPFELALRKSTSPDLGDSPPASPRRPYSLEDDDRADNYLDPRAFNAPIDSVSRAASYQCLTSSTLSGIYSPTNFAAFEDDDVTTQLASRQVDLDDSIHRLVMDRSSLNARRRSSTLTVPSTIGKAATGHQHASTMSYALRTGLLFLLGVGYGAILLRLSTEQSWTAFPVDEIMKTNQDGKHLAAWGLCGVMLGSLLPWFDGKWEEIFQDGQDTNEVCVKDEQGPATDGALVVRGIGAFAGIVLAIRKVPWASTMQVSLTLALSNLLLWYLIDRSKTGFVLSSAVAVAGLIVSLGLNPEMMPVPTVFASQHDYDRNHDHLALNITGHAGAASSETLMLGGLATQRTVETSIWVIAVLFCTCVCFGNIGRRLALNKSAAGRGRWGGQR